MFLEVTGLARLFFFNFLHLDFVAKMNFDEADELRSTFTTYLAEGDKVPEKLSSIEF